MKLKLDELIIDKYYKIDNFTTYYYFKFKGFNKNNTILCDSYYVANCNGKFYYQYYNKELFDKELYIVCTILEQIDIREIVDYLPNNYLDKKICIRKDKIKSLLNVDKESMV